MIKFFDNLAIAATLLFPLFISTSFAQSRAADTNTIAGNEEIRGTVKLPPGDLSGVRVTVTLRSMSSPEVKGFANPEGEFRFTHLRPDSYTIVVDAGDAYEKATETVSVGFSGSVPGQGNPFSHAYPAVYTVLIYLKPKDLAGSAERTAISDAKTPKQVKKSFQQALEDQRKGNHAQAIDHLKAVIAQAPDFVSAYLELGAEYLRTGQGQLAIDTLAKAVKLDPDNRALRLNYCVALLNQKQFAAAESELRLAIQKSKEYSVAAHYYLGVTLVSQQKIDEARTILEEVASKGGEKLPLVHRYLGGIYLQDKQYRRAADELDIYLKLDPKAADANKIRETITESRSKS